MVLTAYFVLFPAIGLFVTVISRIVSRETWHQRRDAKTTRLRRPFRQRSSARSQNVHRIPLATYVTIAIRPSGGAGRRTIYYCFGGDEKHYFGFSEINLLARMTTSWSGFDIRYPPRKVPAAMGSEC
jgi:hypothetical protein